MSAQLPADGESLQHPVNQLRHIVGRWAVITHFLKEDGSVADSVNGSYEFTWVVPDRVVSGKSWKPGDHQRFSRSTAGTR